MARQIQETTEADNILEQIEGAERNLWQLTLAMNTAALDLKEKKKAFDAGIAELRRLARSRLEENPLLDAAEESEE